MTIPDELGCPICPHLWPVVEAAAAETDAETVVVPNWAYGFQRPEILRRQRARRSAAREARRAAVSAYRRWRAVPADPPEAQP